MQRLMFRFAHWRFRHFIAPRLAAKLRAEGKNTEADDLLKNANGPAPKSLDEVVANTVASLRAQGRGEEAEKYQAIADATVGRVGRKT